MPDAEDINNTIAQSAADGIDSVTISGQTVKAQSIDDQIKAAQYLASQNAGSVAHFGLRFSRLIAGPRE